MYTKAMKGLEYYCLRSTPKHLFGHGVKRALEDVEEVWPAERRRCISMTKTLTDQHLLPRLGPSLQKGQAKSCRGEQ